MGAKPTGGADADGVGARPRLRRAEAEAIIETAVLRLLADRPVDEVTNDVIAEETGLNHSYVSRYYGNRVNLLTRLTDVLADRIATDVPADVPIQLPALLADPRFRLRNKIVLHLVGKGVPSQRFYERGLLSRDSIKARLMRLHNVEERIATALAAQVFYSLVGAAFLGHGFDQTVPVEEYNDVIALAFAEILNADTLRRTLNW
jgi:AcrR family transcriptional regulator